MKMTLAKARVISV